MKYDIDKWILEATSGYNDGWTRLHYTEQLLEIKDRLNSLEFLNKDKIKEQYGEAFEKGGHFFRDDEKGECCGAKYNKPNEETIRNFESDKPNVDMGGNYDED